MLSTKKVLALLDEKDKAHAAERLEREQAHEAERQEWAEERRSLLDRIQQPEIRQFAVDPDYQDPEPPATDALAYSQVGQIVPDHIQIGDVPDQDELEKVGTIIGMEP